jgi:hypothetical protein
MVPSPANPTLIDIPAILAERPQLTAEIAGKVVYSRSMLKLLIAAVAAILLASALVMTLSQSRSTATPNAVMDNRADWKRVDAEQTAEPAGFSVDLHLEYQRLFEDFEPTKAGMFGISRLDFEALPAAPAHPRSYIQEQGAELAFFFSRRGKPLSAGELDIQYVRHGLAQGNNLSGPIPPDWAEMKKWASQAGKELTDRANAHATATFQDRDVEARLIRLSKEECLSCHYSMKLGDPVAVMVYQRAQSAKQAVKN